jgi:hypothetical protein
MNFPIFVLSTERDEFFQQLDYVIQSIYDVKYITLFIKKHGVARFEDYFYMPFNCWLCNENYHNHSQHETEYSVDILEQSLINDWPQLFNNHFKHLGLSYFLKWFNLYQNFKLSQIKKIISQLLIF